MASQPSMSALPGPPVGSIQEKPCWVYPASLMASRFGLRRKPMDPVLAFVRREITASPMSKMLMAVPDPGEIVREGGRECYVLPSGHRFNLSTRDPAAEGEASGEESPPPPGEAAAARRVRRRTRTCRCRDCRRNLCYMRMRLNGRVLPPRWKNQAPPPQPPSWPAPRPRPAPPMQPPSRPRRKLRPRSKVLPPSAVQTRRTTA
ncbi:uncharacterized protein LOC124171470 [Ischnura elegans]|uniref:uncharacterized protein LOC124171470 n=1 Tax=Ischnura elegans TaxID=197161 RepID=UPI001ED883D1|nr:uncharacterized protein LOC124171470 [Ischnura elegans]